MEEEGEAAVFWAYFLRVRYQCPATSQSTLQSRARFYVLHAVDGAVFHFTRGTQGQESFQLKPGSEYKLCWALIVGRELKGAAAGALLEQTTDGNEPQVITKEFPPLFIGEAVEVSKDDLAKLGEGYHFTGQMDLRGHDGW